jgi:hypothetical protein
VGVTQSRIASGGFEALCFSGVWSQIIKGASAAERFTRE